MSVRLGIFVTHPIQYFAPLWRGLARCPGINPVVYFFSDHSIRGGIDEGFGIPVRWDTPVLEGYEHSFLYRDSDLSNPRSVRIDFPHRLLIDNRFDAVMVHGYTHAFERQIVRAAHSDGIPVLLRGELSDARRAPWPKRLIRDAYLRWFYRNVDLFCYVGENSWRHLQRFGISDSRMFFSPYSVDNEFFDRERSQCERSDSRHRLKIAEEQVAIVFSGKLISRKRPDLLLDAIARLDRSKIALMILGDGEHRETIHERARALLGDSAILPGFVNQSRLAPYFCAADLLVLPSDFETWGLVVNEALNFGIPAVVSSGVGCHPDLIVPNQTGAVFEAGSVDSLTRCLVSLIERPTCLRGMRVAALERASMYSVQRSVAGIADAIRSIPVLGLQRRLATR